jgi:hypothetical protein
MLELLGAQAGAAAPRQPDCQLGWAQLRSEARPDVLVLLAPERGGPGEAGPGGNGRCEEAGGLGEQLAALAALPGWWSLPAVRNSRVRGAGVRQGGMPHVGCSGSHGSVSVHVPG